MKTLSWLDFIVTLAELSTWEGGSHLRDCPDQDRSVTGLWGIVLLPAGLGGPRLLWVVPPQDRGSWLYKTWWGNNQKEQASKKHPPGTPPRLSTYSRSALRPC